MANRLFKHLKLAIWLAKIEIKSRYNRTALGSFWSSILLFVMVITIGPLYSIIFNQGIEYIANLAIGLFAWQFIINNVLDSSIAFQKIENLYQNKNIGIFVPSFKTLVLNIILSLHQLLPMAIIFFFWSSEFYLKLLLLLPLLFFLSLVMYPINLFISLISLRFKDVQSGLVSINFLVFFLSPIIWSKDLIPVEKKFFIQLNPITHIMTISRDLILNYKLSFNSFEIIILLTVIFNIFLYFFIKKIKNKFIFWF